VDLLQADTQGAQVWIIQSYLQFTPLPRERSRDGVTIDCCIADI